MKKLLSIFMMVFMSVLWMDSAGAAPQNLNDKALFVGRWQKQDNGNMIIGYTGSSMRMVVENTDKLIIKTKKCDHFEYKIDDANYIQSDGDKNGVLKIENLGYKRHTIKIVICSDKATWKGNGKATVVNSIEVDPNGSVKPAAEYEKHAIVYGDSITDGYLVASGHAHVPSATWWNNIADDMKIEITPVGISGIGYIRPSDGDYPEVSAEKSFIENINVKLLDPYKSYDIVFLELGTNDSIIRKINGVDKNILENESEINTEYLNKVNSALVRIKNRHRSAKIYAILPFNNRAKATLTKAYNDNNITIIDTDWYGDIEYTDGLHPNVKGAKTVAKNVERFISTH